MGFTKTMVVHEMGLHIHKYTLGITMVAQYTTENCSRS